MSLSPGTSEPPKSEATGSQELHREVRIAWKSARNMGSSLLGTWTVALVVRFLLPRHLGPAAFGDLNYASTIAEASMLLTALGIDTYTMREVAVRPKHASDYFGGILVLRSVIAVLVTAAITLVMGARGKDANVLVTCLVFAAHFALTGTNNTMATLLQATGLTGRLAIVNISTKILWGVTTAALIFLPSTKFALWVYAVPNLVGEVLRALLVFPTMRSALNLQLRVDFAATKAVVWASFPFFLSSLAVSMAGPLNMSVLEYANTDKRELGWYGAVLNLAGLTMLFSPLLNWVLMPMLSRAGARNSADLGKVVAYALEAFLMGVLPVVLIGMLGADLWIDVALGAEYAPAATSFRIVTMTMAVIYASMILSMGLVAAGHSWTLSTISLVPLIGAPLVAFFSVTRLGELLGTGGQAAGAAVALAVPECFVVLLALLRFGRGVWTRRLARTFAAAALFCAIVTAVDHWLQSIGNLRLCVDLLLYMALLFGTRTVDIREIRALIATLQKARNARGGAL
jgi:O-antigen/teichoic acid export membrane protein